MDLNSYGDLSVSMVLFSITLLTSCIGIKFRHFYYSMLLHPHSIAKGDQLYRLLTAGFIHSNWMQMFLNLSVFVIFAGSLEENMFAINPMGHWYFAAIYLCAILSGNIITVIRKWKNFAYTSIGASGAIMGLTWSYLIFEPCGKLVHLPLLGPMSNCLSVCIYAGGSFYLSCKDSDGSTNFISHFYGALVSVLLTVAFFPEKLKGLMNCLD